jgi:glutathione-regulated potassium-efflux system protein KefB
MGLFFLAVSMSLNLTSVAAEWPLLLAMLVVYVLVKAVAIYATARAFGAASSTGLRRTVMFAQGGEFAFVLYTSALAGEVIDARENAIFSTVVILSMAITPLILIATDRLLRAPGAALDGVEAAKGLRGQVLVIGFGRFGQIALQMLLARGAQVSVIENKPDRIREAARFGFKVLLRRWHAAGHPARFGAAQAQVVLICVDDRRAVSAIVELIQHEFPNAAVLARSYDRGHSMELIRAGVDFEVRETVESALLMGAEGLRRLGWDEVAVAEALDNIRRRDLQRLTEQVQGDLMSGRDKMLREPVPEPLAPQVLQKADS